MNKIIDRLDYLIEAVKPSLKHKDYRVRKATRYGLANLKREKEQEMANQSKLDKEAAKREEHMRIKSLIRKKLKGDFSQW